MPREKMTREAADGVGSRAGRSAQRGCDRRAVCPVGHTRGLPSRIHRRRSTRALTWPAIRDRRRRPPTRCYRYFAGRTGGPDSTPCAAATAPTDRSTTCCPSASKTACRCSCSPWSAIQRGSRSPAPAPRSWPRSRDRCATAGVAAMVYPTMPFNAFRLADGWPDIRTALGYGNWLGLPEVSVPAGLGADGLPALNLSVTGLPGEDARVLALAHAYERQSRRFAPPARPS